ncbi:protein LIKE EARLY STARVATION, chloroplastic [Typha angustifolia]|uniref:protein LIKE EARLY STARVATION, chloroplastic n=1 Tax=Typha angustifolia TaxID=59011 RepID=UPI003C2B38A3
MSVCFNACARGSLRVPQFPSPRSIRRPLPRSNLRLGSTTSDGGAGGSSYLEMWKNANERERRSREFQYITEQAKSRGEEEEEEESLELKTERFHQILEVPKEERDRIQRLQVIDRAAAAIAAARALIKEGPVVPKEPPSDAVRSGSDGLDRLGKVPDGTALRQQGLQAGNSFLYESGASTQGTPGPDFWSWSPPAANSSKPGEDVTNLKPVQKTNSYTEPPNLLMEKEQSADHLLIPLESSLLEDKHKPSLPPLQSLFEVEDVNSKTTSDLASGEEEKKLDVLFQMHAAEAAKALEKSDEASYGVNPDGSKWWKETGIEQRPDGVVCKWTLTRGVSADESIEWEDKYWEASDQFDHKELGSEKSGRDAAGNVWHEYWKESIWQDFASGLRHMEKTADKWGKNGKGGEWQEKWFEHYDASGQAEKWAHKWCCIDPNTPLDAGHAHVWHERWGEKYDGRGGSTKYTDKWAERSEGDGWSKWGDKWDEHFGQNSHGVKQGETWWEGKYGERWNRTWGEQHNGTGWVHKYGQSSSGEHWDTHVQQDTWYERHPHYGFDHCFENSVQLRSVRRPPKTL